MSFLAIDVLTNKVVIAASASDKRAYKCQVCDELLRLQTKGDKRDYFKHEKNKACDGGSGESYQHMAAKIAIRDLLEQLHPEAKVIAEYQKLPLLNPKDRKSRPDVYFEGTICGREVKAAIEVQASRLPQSELEVRSRAYAHKNIMALWVLLDWHADFPYSSLKRDSIISPPSWQLDLLKIQDPLDKTLGRRIVCWDECKGGFVAIYAEVSKDNKSRLVTRGGRVATTFEALVGPQEATTNVFIKPPERATLLSRLAQDNTSSLASVAHGLEHQLQRYGFSAEVREVESLEALFVCASLDNQCTVIVVEQEELSDTVEASADEPTEVLEFLRENNCSYPVFRCRSFKRGVEHRLDLEFYCCENGPHHRAARGTQATYANVAAVVRMLLPVMPLRGQRRGAPAGTDASTSVTRATLSKAVTGDDALSLCQLKSVGEEFWALLQSTEDPEIDDSYRFRQKLLFVVLPDGAELTAADLDRVEALHGAKIFPVMCFKRTSEGDLNCWLLHDGWLSAAIRFTAPYSGLAGLVDPLLYLHYERERRFVKKESPKSLGHVRPCDPRYPVRRGR